MPRLIGSVSAFYITVLDEGLYMATNEAIRPEPMVIIVNGDHMSHYWPRRELTLRFNLVKDSDKP